MGLGLGWVNRCSKKQCRSLFWRMRAAVKKAVKKNGGKQQLRFQYDPWSYALNFDDGCCSLGGGNAFKCDEFQGSAADCKNADLVYVFWVKSM